MRSSNFGSIVIIFQGSGLCRVLNILCKSSAEAREQRQLTPPESELYCLISGKICVKMKFRFDEKLIGNDFCKYFQK